MSRRPVKKKETVLTTYFDSANDRTTFIQKYAPKFNKCIVYFDPCSGYALETPESLLKKAS